MSSINGCKIGAYRRMARKCRACDKREYCQSKRMELEAYIIPESSVTNIYAQEMSRAAAGVGISAAEAAGAITRALEAAQNVKVKNNMLGY